MLKPPAANLHGASSVSHAARTPVRHVARRGLSLQGVDQDCWMAAVCRLVLTCLPFFGPAET